MNLILASYLARKKAVLKNEMVLINYYLPTRYIFYNACSIFNIYYSAMHIVHYALR